MSCTAGRNSADSQAARYDAPYISFVSPVKSARLASSRPSAFTTRTPVMFWLYSPVILELILRTTRYCTRMRFLN